MRRGGVNETPGCGPMWTQNCFNGKAVLWWNQIGSGNVAHDPTTYQAHCTVVV